MKIESMDAANVSYQNIQESSIHTNDFKIETKSQTKENKKVDTELDTFNLSQLTVVEKRELPMPEKIVIDAIEKANKAISGGNRRFKFSIHTKTKEIMIKVIDSETGDIIREIPPEKTLDMVAKFWEMAGIVVDERR